MEEAELHDAPSAMHHVGIIVSMQLACTMVAMGGPARQHAHWSLSLVQVEDPTPPPHIWRQHMLLG